MKIKSNKTDKMPITWEMFIRIVEVNLVEMRTNFRINRVFQARNMTGIKSLK
jgi:hypothetical protein